jgi:hypothetical protein
MKTTVVCLLVAVFLVALVDYFLECNWRNLRLRSREKLPVQEIFHRYYMRADIQENEFNAAWVQLSNALRVSPELLRPEDTFEKLRVPWRLLFTDMDEVSFILHNSSKETSPDCPYPEISNIDQAVRFIINNSRIQGRVK